MSSVVTSRGTPSKGKDSALTLHQMRNITSSNKNVKTSARSESPVTELTASILPQPITVTIANPTTFTLTTPSPGTTSTQLISTTQLTSTRPTTTSTTTTTTVKPLRTLVPAMPPTKTTMRQPTRTSPPRATAFPLTTTQSPTFSCNVTERMWVKTGKIICLLQQWVFT